MPKPPVAHKVIELRLLAPPTITIRLLDGLDERIGELQSRIQAAVVGVRFLPVKDGVLSVILSSSSQYEAAYVAIRHVLVAMARS